MICQVYLVRHGETEWNAKKKVQGHSDIMLSERGREQAKLLAQRLAKKKINCFYSSDLGRAYETAQILAHHHGLTVNATTNLRELNFGAWEGLTAEEVEKISPELFKNWWKNPLDIHIPNGERLPELAARCEDIMKKIISKHMNETVVVVTHGATIRSIICSVLGIKHSELWRIYLDNTCINKIDFPEWDRGVVRVLNDCAHLEDFYC